MLAQSFKALLNPFRVTKENLHRHLATMVSEQKEQSTTNEVFEQENRLRTSDEDLAAEAHPVASAQFDENMATSPNVTTSACPFTFVPLKMGGKGRTHTVSEGSKKLIYEGVTLSDLTKMTDLFYEKAFVDPTLDQFIRSHKDPHGDRFAKWIHQKLTGSSVWDEERRSRSFEPVTLAGGYQHVVHDRSSAHAGAWYSPKRPAHEVGRHFKLDECRVWMRLHFWALRESGLMEKSPSFADYYVRFIGHFVSVYESSAPMFARDSLRWSANPANIQKYIADGNVMTDVLGLTLSEAEDQIPTEEANDFEWPYNEKP